MFLRKLSLLVTRCCLLAFLALTAAAFLADVPLWWPCAAAALWLLLAFGVNLPLRRAARRTAAAAVAAAGTVEPVEVLPPVTGRWRALNSPAGRTPSHGTHALGQTYAIDIVAEPAGAPRPAFGWWPPARRSSAFPAFGAPLLAVADATVVRAQDHRRDHLSRTSLPALLYFLFVEGTFRSLGGPGQVAGNHVVLDLGGGTYAMYAHLRRGSLAVRAGDRVRAGGLLAHCGNSGNSTEPHVHFQLMDGPDLETARGVPFTWRGVGVPAGKETFTAGAVGPPSDGPGTPASREAVVSGLD